MNRNFTFTLGYSTCPNDTFIFYSIANRKIDLEDFNFEIVLDDVETLNLKAETGELQITKLSFAGFARVTDKYAMLRSGAALGRGCGPLIVAKPGFKEERLKHIRIAVPGIRTTASMLLGLYLSGSPDVVPMRFDTIMPAVAQGHFEAGVIIHEGRFTFRNYGLTCVRDLGEWWEQKTGLPIPLGCIAIKREIATETAQKIESFIRTGVTYSLSNPDETREYVRRYAGELASDVIRRHIELYVNPFTIDLGAEGAEAVDALFSFAGSAGILPKIGNPLYAC